MNRTVFLVGLLMVAVVAGYIFLFSSVNGAGEQNPDNIRNPNQKPNQVDHGQRDHKSNKVRVGVQLGYNPGDLLVYSVSAQAHVETGLTQSKQESKTLAKTEIAGDGRVLLRAYERDETGFVVGYKYGQLKKVTTSSYTDGTVTRDEGNPQEQGIPASTEVLCRISKQGKIFEVWIPKTADQSTVLAETIKLAVSNTLHTIRLPETQTSEWSDLVEDSTRVAQYRYSVKDARKDVVDIIGEFQELVRREHTAGKGSIGDWATRLAEAAIKAYMGNIVGTLDLDRKIWRSVKLEESFNIGKLTMRYGYKYVLISVDGGQTQDAIPANFYHVNADVAYKYANLIEKNVSERERVIKESTAQSQREYEELKKRIEGETLDSILRGLDASIREASELSVWKVKLQAFLTVYPQYRALIPEYVAGMSDTAVAWVVVLVGGLGDDDSLDAVFRILQNSRSVEVQEAGIVYMPISFKTNKKALEYLLNYPLVETQDGDLLKGMATQQAGAFVKSFLDSGDTEAAKLIVSKILENGNYPNEIVSANSLYGITMSDNKFVDEVIETYWQTNGLSKAVAQAVLMRRFAIGNEKSVAMFEKVSPSVYQYLGEKDFTNLIMSSDKWKYRDDFFKFIHETSSSAALKQLVERQRTQGQH